jgi:hypothetical protein
MRDAPIDLHKRFQLTDFHVDMHGLAEGTLQRY